MELRQLRYFVEIAGQGSFTKASETLAVAQPALTTQIQKLEAEFNAQLFLRTKRGVVLTEVGRVVLAEAQRVLDAADSTKRTARLAGSAPNARVVVGFSRIFPIAPIVRTVHRLRRAHPNIKVEMREMWSHDQIEAVAGGSLDLGFVYETHERLAPELCAVPVAQEALTVAVPDGHRLAARRTVALTELDGEDWVVAAASGSGETLLDRVMSACLRAGVRPRSVQESASDMRILLGLVSAGVGIALLSSSSRDVRIRGVHYAPIRPVFGIDFTAVYRRGAGGKFLEPFLERMA